MSHGKLHYLDILGSVFLPYLLSGVGVGGAYAGHFVVHYTVSIPAPFVDILSQFKKINISLDAPNVLCTPRPPHSLLIQAHRTSLLRLKVATHYFDFFSLCFFGAAGVSSSGF